MAFDPISHAAGIGAGQEAGQRAAFNSDLEAEQVRSRASIKVESAQNTALALAVAFKRERDAKDALQAEIYNKWIPYGIRMQSGIMANRVQKDDLIAALKASNPENVDHIVQESEKHADVEYARLGKSGSKELTEVNEIVKREAEAGRLDK